MGFILFFVACILGAILYPIGMLYSFLKLTFSYFSTLFKTLALGIDLFGNVTCGHLFNDTLIKKDGYKFGSHKETISKVLGINKQQGTLTKTGRFVADVLNFIDKNHVEDAI